MPRRRCDLCGRGGVLINGVCRRCLASTLLPLPDPPAADRPPAASNQEPDAGGGHTRPATQAPPQTKSTA